MPGRRFDTVGLLSEAYDRGVGRRPLSFFFEPCHVLEWLLTSFRLFRFSSYTHRRLRFEEARSTFRWLRVFSNAQFRVLFSVVRLRMTPWIESPPNFEKARSRLFRTEETVITEV